MKMFKKSLIAASVAVAATAAYAGTITENKTDLLALEGAVAAGSIEVGTDVNVIIETAADYIVNDVVEITISGADIKKVAAGGDPELAVNSSGSGEANFIDLNSETGVVRFRVQAANIDAEDTLTLSKVAIDSTGFSDKSTITASARAISSNSLIGAYDPSSAKVIGTARQQFSAKFDNSFDQVIDVNSSRELFAGSGDKAADDDETGFDRVDLTLTDNVNGKELGNYSFTATRATHTVVGEDFSYAMAFDSDEDGELASDELCATSGTATMVTVASGTGTFTCSIDGNTLTLVQAGSLTASENVQLNFNAPGADSGYPVSEQSFSASISVANGTGASAISSAAASSVDAGSWTLNGASVYVPYMPYSNGISQIIYVSNKGTQAGTIEVTAFDDAGNEYGPYDLGTAEGKNITKITGALEDALAADNFSSGKLAFTLTVTAPDSAIEVYTGYNAGNDRGLVINSSNKD
ncbi:hypothetical protein LG288_02560 [Idiomarina seosinensis]|uniref:hypothetical protein n=1 Tax=Idiomarina seosinensis TaxID=281739 RepID=UPI00384E46A7